MSTELIGEELKLRRPDGSTLVAYLARPREDKSFPILLILQGSQRESVLRWQENLKGQIDWGLLAIEKRGIGESIDEEEFSKHQSLEERFQDHQLVLHALKKGAISSWNGKWALMGQGEGGKIAASLAARHKDVAALILIAAGGGWDPQEELLRSLRQEMIREEFTPYYIHSALILAKEQLEKAKKEPVWDQECLGFSHLYWASLLQARLPEDLRSIDCPIYYAHGDQDDRIPTASVDALLQQLKSKSQFTCRREAEMGREIVRSPETYQAAFAWLKGL